LQGRLSLPVFSGAVFRLVGRRLLSTFDHLQHTVGSPVIARAVALRSQLGEDVARILRERMRDASGVDTLPGDAKEPSATRADGGLIDDVKDRSRAPHSQRRETPFDPLAERRRRASE
jgi:hypothetical protein